MLDQFFDPQIFRTNPVQRANPPTQDVIASTKSACLLNGSHVFRLFDDAEQTLGVTAESSEAEEDESVF